MMPKRIYIIYLLSTYLFIYLFIHLSIYNLFSNNKQMNGCTKYSAASHWHPKTYLTFPLIDWVLPKQSVLSDVRSIALLKFLSIIFYFISFLWFNLLNLCNEDYLFKLTF